MLVFRLEKTKEITCFDSEFQIQIHSKVSGHAYEFLIIFDAINKVYPESFEHDIYVSDLHNTIFISVKKNSF